MKTLFVGKSSSTRIQLFRYLFVGGSAAVVDLVSFSVLAEVLHIHYLLSAFFAYMFGLAWNHAISVLWVFESKYKRTREVAMVFFIALGGLFWTELLLWVGVDMFGFGPIETKVVVLWIVLIWNFGMRKLFVFH